MNIFLSGKMDETHGAWRDHILGVDLSYNHQSQKTEQKPRWAIYTKIMDARGVWKEVIPVLPWVAKQGIVLDQHTYTGPFRQIITDYAESKNLGYFHGITTNGQHGWMDEKERGAVLSRCLVAIASSDLVFAHINTSDCFGTLAELGYARALGKAVAVAFHQDAEELFDGISDTWFIEELANHTTYNRRDEPEPLYIRRSLLEGISSYVGKPGPSGPLAAAIHSLSQIYTWSADPRVREEAANALDSIRGKTR